MSETISQIRSQVHQEVQRVIVGQEALIDQFLVALFSNGHILLEGVPGVAKTLLSKTLAQVIGADFRRIQFTPDLMPSDIVGTKVFDFSDSKFKTTKGPIFSNIVLVDEVNRAPAKTQAAMLEVMEERQVTIEGETYKMEDPFMIIATQNPIEFEGTYNLPEAQLDRFLLKVVVGYPEDEQELVVLRRIHEGLLGSLQTTPTRLNVILTKERVAALREHVRQVTVDEGILKYINTIVRSTRHHPQLLLGSSPRGAISLLQTSKAQAALQGRSFVNPDDIKSLAMPVLRHRVAISPEAEIDGFTADQIIQAIVNGIEVPR